MNRRQFLSTLGASLLGSRMRAGNSARFFTLAQRHGRWWFITPKGGPFFSIGLNHIDPSPLRYLDNGDLWQRKYGNSMERWLKDSVAPDLRAWGFNCVGWTQEVVTRGLTNQRHSRAFTFEEYQWLGLPYCHLLPFADFHQWEAETRYPDFQSSEFADWCDYVARENCARIKELFELATRWYRITHDAVRRYDRHHLIFGDRYEAAKPIADEVITAAKPYVDVLCFQHFSTPDTVAENLARWHQKTGKPVLLADHARSIRGADGYPHHNGAAYAETLRRLRDVPGCVGYHLCGAYLRNETRKRGLRDASEKPDAEALQAMTQANREAAEWMRREGRE